LRCWPQHDETFDNSHTFYRGAEMWRAAFGDRQLGKATRPGLQMRNDANVLVE
jgi:hypothetical protein